MIVATSKTFPGGIRVSGLVDRGKWFGQTWLVLIGEGYVPLVLVVEGDHEQAVVDAIVDSKRWGHELTDDVEPCNECQQAEEIEQANREMGQETPYEVIRELRDCCSCDFAGNYGDRIDSTRITLMERCKVNYFTKGESK